MALHSLHHYTIWEEEGEEEESDDQVEGKTP
jgi:hypothetical protein